MQELLTYIAEGGTLLGVVGFVLYKWVIPFIKGLYNELVNGRKTIQDLLVKGAKLEAENNYLKDKYFHHSRGKKRDNEQG